MYKSFEKLPLDVQKEVKSYLRAYGECNVIFEGGTYNCSPSLCIKGYYSDDYEFVGSYKATEIFTEVERIENYINCFKDYPREYKGERDYRLLNKMRKSNNKKLEGKINNEGNFEIINTITTEQLLELLREV